MDTVIVAIVSVQQKPYQSLRPAPGLYDYVHSETSVFVLTSKQDVVQEDRKTLQCILEVAHGKVLVLVRPFIVTGPHAKMLT